MITIHLSEVHSQMAILCHICQAFDSMTAQNILDHWSVCKGSVTESAWSMVSMEHDIREVHGKAQNSKDLKKELISHKLRKTSKSQGQKVVSESLRLGEHRSTKDAAKKC